jgi:hypothetical protein
MLKTFHLYLFTFLFTALAIFYNYRQLQTPTDVETASADFSVSQYVLGEGHLKEIGDDTAYIAAANDYLSGADPTGMNFEHPPHGKYLFGFSLALTGNVLWVNVLAYALITFCLALLARAWRWSLPLSLGTIFLILANPFMLERVGIALLDLMYLAAALSFFTVLFLMRDSWSKYLLLGISLGFFWGIKYYFPLIFLLIIPLFFTLIRQRPTHSFPKLALTLLLALLIYLLGYTRYFQAGHSFLDWLKFEWYTFNWRIGDRSMPKFLIWQSLYTGRYFAWWEGGKAVIIDHSWNLLLPVYFTLALLASSYLLIKRQLTKLPDQILAFYNLGLITICSFGGASSLHYLTIGIPFWLLALARAVNASPSTSTCLAPK